MKTITRPLKRSAAALLLLAFSVATARADATEDRIAALQAKFRCPIFEYLGAIRRAAHRDKEQNRFLIAEVTPGDGRYFVQCAYFDMDQKLHCEAASAYYDKRLNGYFTSERLKALGALGYSTEASSMNYYFERATANAQSLYDLAGVLVVTLGRVFDMQLDEALAYHAPLVKRLRQSKSDGKFCTPQLS
jgi:hypothetical protein